MRASVDRRNFLKVGMLGAMGCSAMPSSARAARPNYSRDRTVVLLFLSGGPSQLEAIEPIREALIEA